LLYSLSCGLVFALFVVLLPARRLVFTMAAVWQPDPAGLQQVIEAIKASQTGDNELLARNQAVRRVFRLYNSVGLLGQHFSLVFAVHAAH
jgi:hypothetical protein